MRLSALWETQSSRSFTDQPVSLTMNLVGCVVFVLVLAEFLSFVEPRNRKRGRDEQRRLRELCRRQRRMKFTANSSPLELHAFFNLRPNNKAFACLKISTCHGAPVCFVTSHPYLNSKDINDTTTWQDLIAFIQKDRKIEPIYDNSMSGWNGDKYKALGQYVQNQPAIYRMCRYATVYRFVANDNATSNNSTPPVEQAIGPHGANSTHPVTLCPLLKRTRQSSKLKKKQKMARRKRVHRSRHNVTSNNFLLCQGFNCPCVRICVGQGQTKQTFSQCSTFRIICTFNCSENKITIPDIVPSLVKPPRPNRRQHKNQRPKRRRKPRRKLKNQNRKKKGR